MKQATVLRSSMEAEYRGLAQAAYEVLWVQAFIKELVVVNINFYI